jgi:hypothetical protein
MSHPDTRRCSVTADLLDLIAEADAAKQAGLAAVTDDRWWQATAEQAVRALAQRGEPFQIFSVVLLGCPEPSSPAQWGSLTHRLAKAGVLKQAGYAPSLRPTVKGSICRLWMGA